MNADEFRDYILGFIFYKYLSEKMNMYANEILKEDGITYHDFKENSKDGKAILAAIKEQALIKLGYFLKPSELFYEIAKRGNCNVENEKGRNEKQFYFGRPCQDTFQRGFQNITIHRI